MNEPRFEIKATVEDRTELFRLMREEGLDKVNLYNDPSLEHWLELTKPGLSDVWYAPGWGTYYLTQGFGATPFAHFFVFPGMRKHAKKFLCSAIAHGFKLYSFNAVLGLTPKKYRHVFPVIREAGFELVTVIPDAVVLNGKTSDGVLSILRREKWESDSVQRC